jgi:hypothetical protein
MGRDDAALVGGISGVHKDIDQGIVDSADQVRAAHVPHQIVGALGD